MSNQSSKITGADPQISKERLSDFGLLTDEVITRLIQWFPVENSTPFLVVEGNQALGKTKKTCPTSLP